MPQTLEKKCEKTMKSALKQAKKSAIRAVTRQRQPITKRHSARRWSASSAGSHLQPSAPPVDDDTSIFSFLYLCTQLPVRVFTMSYWDLMILAVIIMLIWIAALAVFYWLALVLVGGVIVVYGRFRFSQWPNVAMSGSLNDKCMSRWTDDQYYTVFQKSSPLGLSW